MHWCTILSRFLMNETKSYVDRLQLRALYCKSTACTANAFKQIELCHLRGRHRCSITQCETSSSALVFGLTLLADDAQVKPTCAPFLTVCSLVLCFIGMSRWLPKDWFSGHIFFFFQNSNTFSSSLDLGANTWERLLQGIAEESEFVCTCSLCSEDLHGNHLYTQFGAAGRKDAKPCWHSPVLSCGAAPLV